MRIKDIDVGTMCEGWDGMRRRWEGQDGVKEVTTSKKVVVGRDSPRLRRFMMVRRR